ncbi:hypothetical protein [Halobacillus andaensis]|uniref:hypothetical protein n=1 Tax=Halobacillus andaensis TaxID=1176239 RepID=UPI003D712A79
MNSLSREEEYFLHKHFRYFIEEEEEKYGITKGTTLCTKSGVQETIDFIHVYMQSEFLLTSASILSKRYSYYIASVPLASMTLFNKMPNMNLENIELIRTTEEKKWFPKIRLLSQEVSQPAEGERMDWMLKELTNLFSFHIRPLFLHINQLTRLSMDVMWENIALYMFRFYEKELSLWYDEAGVRNLKEDLYFIVERLPGEVFGMKRNPFSYFLYQPLLSSGARKRKCCCLSYKLYQDSNFCKTCPHLEDQ